MTLIVCVDDRGGMLFNGRRQSSDRHVTQRICDLAKKSRLLVNPYTAKLFSDDAVTCVDGMLQTAQAQDCCFVENEDITPFAEAAKKIILFRWNRIYPADLYFPMEVLEQRKLSSKEEFTGNSHERITMEVYTW